MGSIPRWGRSPGGGHGNPLQYSCLENPMDRGAWPAMVHRVIKSWNDWSNLTYMHARWTWIAKARHCHLIERSGKASLTTCHLSRDIKEEKKWATRILGKSFLGKDQQLQMSWSKNMLGEYMYQQKDQQREWWREKVVKERSGWKDRSCRGF